MTTIAFIGAGSTVFTRNLCGDILQRAALAGSTIRLMDIDPKRLEESEIVVRKLIRTLDAPATVETFLERRRALEGADFVVVSFQIGGYRPCTVTDFEVPKQVRPAPDHWGHARRGRNHARAAHGAPPVEALRGHDRGLPRRRLAAVRQPDGHQHLGHRGEVPGDPADRSLSLHSGDRRGARARSRSPGRGDSLSCRRHQPHGVLPHLRAPPPGRRRPRSLSRAAPWLSRRALSQAQPSPPELPEQGALRNAAAARLLRDRELGALRGVHAVLHQARPAGPHRAVRDTARRLPAPLRGPDRGMGRADRAIPRGRVDRGWRRATSTHPRSSTRP